MKKSHKKRIIIVGAGKAGQELVLELKKHSLPLKIVGFLDDDKKKQGKLISRFKVLGRIKDLDKVTSSKKIDELFIAIPSGSGRLMQKIVNKCRNKNIRFRIIPRVIEIIEGRVDLERVREIEPEDLLGRAVLKTDLGLLRKLLAGKTILITGAAGSIGSEIVRQAAFFAPKRIICLDWWENGLYYLELDLKRKFPKGKFEFVVANIQDRVRMNKILSQYKPLLVFHAAAFKHVPIMEENPLEAVKNNIIATYSLAQLSIKHKVKKFLFLSTDKAVNPESVMGATKLFAEYLIHDLNRKKKTKFISVRFGNVLASQGSVIPIFKEQILSGGPVTITDKRAFRFFMTITEAVQLILQATNMGKGGEIFALEMGEPVKILNLAKDLIKFYGFSPKEIKIKIVGLRPGEKLGEEDLEKLPDVKPTKIDKIYKFKIEPIAKKDLKLSFEKLEKAVFKEDTEIIIKILEKTLPSFNSNNNDKKKNN